MGEEHGELRPDLETNEIDDFVRAVHASVGAVPGIGPMMAAMVTRACRHLADSQAWLELLPDAADSG
jgi:hypothetical protein